MLDTVRCSCRYAGVVDSSDVQRCPVHEAAVTLYEQSVALLKVFESQHLDEKQDAAYWNLKTTVTKISNHESDLNLKKKVAVGGPETSTQS